VSAVVRAVRITSVLAAGDPNAVVPLDDGSYSGSDQTPIHLNFPDDLPAGSIVTVSLADNSDPRIKSPDFTFAPAQEFP
jgi:hypothetical protein